MKFISRTLGAFLLTAFLLVGTPSLAVAQEEYPPTPDSSIVSEADGPFAQWGLPTPPGAEGYEVNEVSDAELNPQGLKEWHPTSNPNIEIVPGQMRSDREEIPAGIGKAEADFAETREAQLSDSGDRAANAQPGCRIYWPTSFQVCGLIREKYDSIGGPTSFLLLPKTNELTNPDGTGKRTEFVNGYIYWHPSTGAHTVSIPASTVWARHGWEQGFLGYPVSSDVAQGNSWYKQDFQGGHIYTHNALPATQASIQGAIYEKWQAMGGQNSELGFPISDELTTPDGIGRYNVFEHGMIYWTPRHGAHPVMDPVLLDWAAEGYEKSAYGYPTGDPRVQEGFVSQDFEGGTLQSFKVEDVPGQLLQGSIPYIKFDNDSLAAEFFDRVEAGLEELPPNDISNRAVAKQYGPCELSLDNPHPRKSSNFGAVGFKPHTRCKEEVLKVTHSSDLRYKYYFRWKKAPNLRATESSITEPKVVNKYSLPFIYSTLDIEQDCAGKVPTSFIGVTQGKIETSTGIYYARVYSSPARVDCKIPGND